MSAAKQAEFQIRFIWWALGIAIFAGFAIGAHVASVIGLDLPLGPGFQAYIQTHGHLQLMGWAGLFIVGISLHFIPRLAGAPITQPRRLEAILWTLSAGLVLRFVAHSILPYAPSAVFYRTLALLIVLSAVIECAGVLLYLTTLRATIRQGEVLSNPPALQQIKPFFQFMLAGWLLYPILNLILVLNMALNGAVALDPPWNEFAVNLFVALILLPVAFAFSIRMFPLYLRLPPIDWRVPPLAWAFLATACLHYLPTLPPVLTWPTQVPYWISNLGMVG